MRCNSELDVAAVSMPENTKAVIRIMEAIASLATMSKAEVDRIAHGHNTTVGVHLHQFARALRNAYDASLGRTAKDALVWDLDDVGFEPQPSGRRPRPRGASVSTSG